MQEHSQYLRSNFIHHEPRELLPMPVSILLGVSAEAKESLKSLQIFSVFDLATSHIFANARKIVEVTRSTNTTFGRYGGVPADVVDNDGHHIDVTELHLQPFELLEGIGPNNGLALREALQVETIRDLALWPPYLAALNIVTHILTPEDKPEFDPEAPLDLIPRSGEFPTEKVFYKSVVIDEIEGQGSEELSGQVDLASLSTADAGFDTPATGAIITMEQAWYAQGVALGNLLHSVALAPGESTKIAMVDWSRQTAASTDEETTQVESLSSGSSHNRAISEVTNAVATEAQSGWSNTTSAGTSASAGMAMGGLAGPMLFGGSQSGSINAATALTVSASSGQRNLMASMNQNVADRTQQHANAARTRRASVVQEVSQQENETLTTRTITNYNHMHALSIQYYEVVQIYRTTTRISNVEKCLFIPMKIIQDWTPQLIGWYRAILLQAMPPGPLRQKLRDGSDSAEIQPGAVDFDYPYLYSAGHPDASENSLYESRLAMARDITGLPVAEDIHTPWRLPSGIVLYEIEVNNRNLRFPVGEFIDQVIVHLRDGTSITITVQKNFVSTTLAQPLPLADIVGVDIVYMSIVNKRLNDSVYDPEDDPIYYSAWNNLRVYINLRLRQGGVEFDHLIHGSKSTAGQAHGQEWFRESIREERAPELDEGADRPGYRQFVTVPAVSFSSKGVGVSQALADHFAQHRTYYSQAIWMNMGSANLSLLLSRYTYNQKPLLQQIDPVPVAMTGNYIGFRMNADPEEDEAWRTWLANHGYYDEKDGTTPRNTAVHETVPLPSGGVFAEAVLGRFNAAEKLDPTRFWNWQDSPIPFAAPEIAPLQAGNKTQNIDPGTGKLEGALIQQMAPTALPDPQGMTAIINALATSNMFRDMSGMAHSATLAQAAIKAATEAATAAGNQAGANMATFGEFYIKYLEKVMPMLTSMLGGAAGMPMLPGGGSPGKANISNLGAMLNQGKKLDDLIKQAGGTGSGSTGNNSPGGSQGASSTNGSNRSFAEDAFRAGVGGPQLASFIDPTQSMLWPGSNWSPATSQNQINKTLLVFIENTGDLSQLWKHIPVGVPDTVKEFLEGQVDYWIEEAEKWRFFDDAVGSHYGQAIFLEDETSTEAKFKDTLKDLAKAGHLIDIITIGHGDTNSLQGYVDQDTSTYEQITDSTLKNLRSEYGSAMPIRMVYMMNCKSSSLNQAWVDLGAMAVAGSDGDNYMPEPWLHYLWQNWLAGMPFRKAVETGYEDSKGIWETAYRAVYALGIEVKASVSPADLVAESAPVFAGANQSVTISWTPLPAANANPDGVMSF